MSFHYFSSPLIPTEIQDLILTYAIRAYPARLIELHLGIPATIKSRVTNEKINVTYNLTASAPIPPLLHVSSRTRQLAQQRWSLTFPSPYFDADLANGEVIVPEEEDGIARTWFDFNSDVLVFFGDTSQYESLTLPELEHFVTSDLVKRIKNVGIGLYAPLTAHGGWRAISEDFPGQMLGREVGMICVGLERFVVVWAESEIVRDADWGSKRAEGRGFKVVEAKSEEEEKTRSGLERGIREGRDGVEGVEVDLAVFVSLDDLLK